MKHVARVEAKKFTEGLREVALQHLQDLNLMPPRMEREMNESVMPWIMSKLDAYM